MCGAPGRNFALPRWGWWLLALVIALAVGQIALSAGLDWLAALAHVAAGMLPAFLILALALGSARRGGGQVGARPTVGSLAWGGLGGVGLALTIEMILVLGLLIIAGIYLSLARPDSLRQLQEWAMEMQRSGGVPDLGELAPLARSPWVWMGVLGFGCVLVPLIEEGAKGLALPLVRLTGRRLTRLDGFILGVAAGAGFALFESTANASLALGAGTAWWALMLLRVGSTAMHCLATGLVGLGWEAGLTERRWGRGAGLGLAAVALHAAWNFSALGASLVALGVAGSSSSLVSALGGLVSLALIGLLGLLYLTAIIAPAVIPRRLTGG